jgi:hypothetical protein
MKKNTLLSIPHYSNVPVCVPVPDCESRKI